MSKVANLNNSVPAINAKADEQTTITRKAVDYLILAADGMVIGTATAGAVILTLPNIDANNDGKKRIVGSEGNAVNAVTLTADATDTIAGAATHVFAANTTIEIIADLATNNWIIIL